MSMLPVSDGSTCFCRGMWKQWWYLGARYFRQVISVYFCHLWKKSNSYPQEPLLGKILKMEITMKARGIRTAGQQGREDSKFMAATVKCHPSAFCMEGRSNWITGSDDFATFPSTLNALKNPSAYAMRNNMVMLTTKSYCNILIVKKTRLQHGCPFIKLSLSHLH